MVAVTMVHRFIIFFLIGVSVPVIIARPRKDIKNDHQEREYFDEDRPEAILNCTTTGNSRKSSTNSNVYVKAYDSMPNRYMDMSIYLDGRQQPPTIKKYNIRDGDPKPHKKMVIRMMPVPVMIEEDEEEETYPFEYPYSYLPPGGGNHQEHHFINDETLSEDKTFIISDNETISNETVTQCDENISQPCTEDENNPKGHNSVPSVVEEIDDYDLEDDLTLSSEEDTSDIETNVKQRVGLMTKDPIKASQLSQNVKISNRITSSNGTNSSHDCIKHHIIQIININSKDLDDENYGEWYEVDDETKTLGDDLLVNSSVNKTTITAKDIVLLFKKILNSADPSIKQERRNESISYAEKEESYDRTKEDLTIRTDESETITTEEENPEDDDLETNKEDKNMTTTITDNEESESLDVHEEEIEAGILNEKSFSKRASLEATETLEQRDPLKRSSQIEILSSIGGENTPMNYKHYDEGRTTVQKIPKRIKLAGSSNMEVQEEKRRTKREIPNENQNVHVYNITQTTSIVNKNRKEQLPSDPTTTNIEQGVVIYDNPKTHGSRVIKIKIPSRNSDNGGVCDDKNGVPKDNGAGQGPTSNTFDNSQQDNTMNAENYDKPSAEALVQNVEIDQEDRSTKEKGDQHQDSADNGAGQGPTGDTFDNSQQDTTINAENNEKSSSEELVQNVEIDQGDRSTKEKGGQDQHPAASFIPPGSEIPCEERTGCANNNEDNTEHQLSRKPVVDGKCKEIIQILNLVPNKFRKSDFPQVINQIAQIFPYPELARNIKEVYPSLVLYEGDN